MIDYPWPGNCDTCFGMGYLRIPVDEGIYPGDTTQVNCEACDGTGWV